MRRHGKMTGGNTMAKYVSCVLHCPQTGSGERRVHRWILSAANLAVRACVGFGRWTADIASHATRPVSDIELCDAWSKASGKPTAGVLQLRRPVIKPATLSAAEFIKRGSRTTEADLRAASPVKIDWGNDRRLSACALLRALFLPSELVYCGYENAGVVLERDDWIGRFMDNEFKPPLLCVNPLKPGGGVTVTGKPSMRCDDAVAVFRHAVAEMDSMPLPDQFRFWMGFGLEAVTAITFSGGKSLHVLTRVDALDRAEWDRKVKGDLFRRCLIPLGCDKACVNPSRLTRLAGARRPEKDGAVQRLLFVREEMK